MQVRNKVDGKVIEITKYGFSMLDSDWEIIEPIKVKPIEVVESNKPFPFEDIIDDFKDEPVKDIPQAEETGKPTSDKKRGQKTKGK